MDTSEFNLVKQEVLSRPICYRELEAKEIIALGENHYTVGNAIFEVEPRVASKIDRGSFMPKSPDRTSVPTLTAIQYFMTDWSEYSAHESTLRWWCSTARKCILAVRT